MSHITALVLPLCLLGATMPKVEPTAVKGTEHFAIGDGVMGEGGVNFYAYRLELTDQRPAGVKKEPEYQAKPRYGVIRLGNGPRSAYTVAVDEPVGGEWRIFIDKSQNGDLTSGGDGAWNQKQIAAAVNRTMYGPMNLTFRASYGNANKETSSSMYTISVRQFTDMPTLSIGSVSTRRGELTVDGKRHKAILIECNGDALFRRPAEHERDFDSASEFRSEKPIRLEVDLDDDGDYSSGWIDVRSSFRLDGKSYRLDVSDDGASVNLLPAPAVTRELTPTVEALRTPLKPGALAPELPLDRWGAGQIKPSDYRGKMLLVYFWRPEDLHLSEELGQLNALKQKYGRKNVEVLAVCCETDAGAYTDWLRKNPTRFSFQFALDPDGSLGRSSPIMKRWKLQGTGISYLLDPNGVVLNQTWGWTPNYNHFESLLKGFVKG